MTTPTWQAGTLYSPGAVVRRNSVPAVVALAPTNADFESGDTGWTKETGWSIENDASKAFSGTWAARYTGVTGTAAIYNSTLNIAQPGLAITASCMVNQGGSDAGDAAGKVFLEWLDASFISLRIDDGNNINSSSDGKFKKSTVSATAPASTAYVRVGALCRLESASKSVRVDTFVWDYAYQPEQDGLIFRAVQASPGYSGGTEPAWPTVLGVQVVDNDVTWEAIDSSFVTWEATPILVSGSTEPDFPTSVDEEVADNTISWRAISRRVEDEKCPHGPIVVTGASKIFCADDDIIAFSATTNPLDWSTVDDAGYLPFGLQTYGANPVAAMGLYRGNLVAFNSTGFQMWQIDEDPASMALLDAVPVACTEPKTPQPFANDLVFLSAIGVRNIGIAGASTNLQAGEFGEPVDPLVRTLAAAALTQPLSATLPVYGQYWLVFDNEVVVLTSNGAKSRRWSRYTFETAITDITLNGNDVYLRNEQGHVLKMTDEETADDVYCQPDAVVLSGSLDVDYLIMSLTWTEATFEEGIAEYIVLRAADGGTFIEITRTDDLAYDDTTVEANTLYTYVVVAVPSENGINSEPSNEVSAIAESIIPAATLTGEMTDDDATLDWTVAGTESGSVISAYQLYRRREDETDYTLVTETDGSTFTYLDEDLTEALVYFYYVVAVDDEGNTVSSNTINLSWNEVPVDLSLPFINGGAEYGDLTGWTATAGTFVVLSSGSPPEGVYSFRGGVTANCVMHQTSEITADAAGFAAIDAGSVRLTVEWYAGTYQMAFTDSATLRAYFLDEDQIQVGSTLVSGPFIPDGPAGTVCWAGPYTPNALLPAGTRYVKIECTATRNAGTNNDGRFDGINPFLTVEA
jgi:hypothetical protein